MIHPEDKEWSRLAALSMLRLSATGYDARHMKEYRDLLKLKIHFSLLDDEKGEFDEVKPKYYGKTSDINYIIFLITIMGLFLWFGTELMRSLV